jgi:PAS domain S-box-containing protein
MNRPVHILHLEDDRDYSWFLEHLLAEEGMNASVVLALNRLEFEAALEGGNFDLILADYVLPEYDGLTALHWARARLPEIPFIMISGAVGEQLAIGCLKAGATDFILKTTPERLVPAMRRAVQEAEERKQRRLAEAEVVRREHYFRTLTENSLDLLAILDREARFKYCSASVRHVLGYSPEAVLGTVAFEFIHPEDLERVRGVFGEALLQPTVAVRVQFRGRHASGEWRYLEVMGQNHLSEAGLEGVVINLRDVTDRKQAENEVRESEKQYRLIFDGNPTPMWVFDNDTLAFLEVNDAAVHHYGYTREEFLCMKMADLRPRDEIPGMLEYLHRLVAEGMSPRFGLAGVWHHLKKDGSVIDVEIKWSGVKFKGHSASLAMANDITERKRVEHRDAVLAQLGQNLSSATSPSEAARIILAVAEELFRWDAFTLNLYSSEEELITPLLNVDTDREGRKFEVTNDYSRKSPTPLSRRIVEEGAELILRSDDAPGDPAQTRTFGDTGRRSRSLVLVPIRNRTKVIGLLSIQSYSSKAYGQRDLAALQMLADHCGGALERIHAEQALHESEQRFRQIFQNSPDAIFVEDLNGRVLDVNSAACQLHHMSRAELVGQNVQDLVPLENRESVIDGFKDLRTGKVRQVEGFSRTRDGKSVPVEVRAGPVEFSGTKALLLHVRDISARKAAEEAMRSSELRFRSVWENSGDSMCLTDANAVIVAVNEGFCRLAEQPREKLEGALLSVIYSADENPKLLLAAYQENFQNRISDRRVERRRKLWNGNVVTLEETSSFIEVSDKPTLLLWLFRDVTAQKRLEEQLRHSQKMEAIGQLAGGVAHDFNNILTVIHGHGSLLLANGGLTGTLVRSAQQVVQAAERAAALTRQLLLFGRRQVIQLKRIDLNESVSNMTQMLSRILGEDIVLQLRYSPRPAVVRADAGMMEQILLNLAVNSRDAMPGGGTLEIGIQATTVPPEHLAQHPQASVGQFMCLSVRDTGAGIKPEHMRRIFEPFFTTKPVGKGTGLGLATVYGIVKQHQGWVEVSSELGKGTEFKVYLPACIEEKERVPIIPPNHNLQGGKETLLVVEDEKAVRELVCTLLTALGYRVISAESGVKALDVWARHKDEIDLVLTDLVMPDGLNGRELAEKLWAERPDLKVMFTSGYSADVVGADFVQRHGLYYLQKPYHPRKLAQFLRACLEEHASAPAQFLALEGAPE